MPSGGKTKKLKNNERIFLDENYERYKIMYESSTDAIMTLEPPKWKFTSGNPATVKMFGVENEKEFISLNPGDLSPEFQLNGKKSQTESMKMIKKAMKEGSAFFNWTHRKYNGENFPATVLLTRFKFKGRDILGATVRDISKQKELEEKIKINEERLEDMFNYSPMGIELYSSKGKLEKVNTATLKMFGIENEKEILGFDLFEDPNIPKSVKEKIKKGEIVKYENIFDFDKVKKFNLYNTIKKGIAYLSIIITPIKNGSSGYLVMAEDITESRNFHIELQKKLEEMEKINRLMVGRELKMIELKKKLEKLEKKQ